jgi:hypothetical protein
MEEIKQVKVKINLSLCLIKHHALCNETDTSGQFPAINCSRSEDHTL